MCSQLESIAGFKKVRQIVIDRIVVFYGSKKDFESFLSESINDTENTIPFMELIVKTDAEIPNIVLYYLVFLTNTVSCFKDIISAPFNQSACAYQ